ncbi:MAG: AhpC/TSA family protein [Gammaproteobacteria bacterium]|nr:AhpC/TSA family protein [Gammaproteobacteria bacterium]
MKKSRCLIVLMVVITTYVNSASAEVIGNYKQARDLMMKKSANDNKKAPLFTKAERQFMKDSMEAVKKKYPSPGLKAGTTAPDFTLPDASGKQVNLFEQLKQGPVILVFYRGAWCPFCNLHLHALHKSMSAFEKYNASVIAVTPQQPDQSLKQVKKDKYPFEILSDLDDVVMKKYGLYYQLSPELNKLYKSKGLDVEAFNGKGRTGLPVPGTFVIGQDRIIKAVHAQHDYIERMEPAEILKVLKSLK